jgi:hypothetical protein
MEADVRKHTAEINVTKCAVITGLTTLCHAVSSDSVPAAATTEILLRWEEDFATRNVLSLNRSVCQSVCCLDW